MTIKNKTSNKYSTYPTIIHHTILQRSFLLLSYITLYHISYFELFPPKQFLYVYVEPTFKSFIKCPLLHISLLYAMMITLHHILINIPHEK